MKKIILLILIVLACVFIAKNLPEGTISNLVEKITSIELSACEAPNLSAQAESSAEVGIAEFTYETKAEQTTPETAVYTRGYSNGFV